MSLKLFKDTTRRRRASTVNNNSDRAPKSVTFSPEAIRRSSIMKPADVSNGNLYENGADNKVKDDDDIGTGGDDTTDDEGGVDTPPPPVEKDIEEEKLASGECEVKIK